MVMMSPSAGFWIFCHCSCMSLLLQTCGGSLALSGSVSIRLNQQPRTSRCPSLQGATLLTHAFYADPCWPRLQRESGDAKMSFLKLHHEVVVHSPLSMIQPWKLDDVKILHGLPGLPNVVFPDNPWSAHPQPRHQPEIWRCQYGHNMAVLSCPM